MTEETSDKPRRYRGKGRKPAKEARIDIRCLPEEKALFLRLGGSKAFRAWLSSHSGDGVVSGKSERKA